MSPACVLAGVLLSDITYSKCQSAFDIVLSL